MSEIRFTHRLRYAFDNSMSKGAVALIGYLGLASLGLIMVAGLVVILFRIIPGGESEVPGFGEAMWLSLMRTLDSGTMGGDLGSGFRVTMLFVTLGGIFIVSSLIGVINNGIEAKLDELRKGRSFVVERDHTLILGWSPKIFTILSELVLANDLYRTMYGLPEELIRPGTTLLQILAGELPPDAGTVWRQPGTTSARAT